MREVSPRSGSVATPRPPRGEWTYLRDVDHLKAEVALAVKEGRPTVIDFWATWCKNCLVMDKTTLADPAVTAALSGYTCIKFQAEDADASPAKELLQRISAVGLPAYVVLQPK